MKRLKADLAFFGLAFVLTCMVLGADTSLADVVATLVDVGLPLDGAAIGG